MAIELACGLCQKHMAVLRDARVRNGMVVYCRRCNALLRRAHEAARGAGVETPDFLKGLFGGRHE